MFAKIDKIMMSRVNAPGDHGILEIRYEAWDDYMPETFRDLREANKYLNHHIFCTMPHIARLPHVFMKGPQEQSAEQVALGLRLLDQTRQWSSGFAPLLVSAWKDPESHDFISAGTLKCLMLVSEMSIRMICGTGDHFGKEATEILDLTNRIVMNQKYRNTFAFDCGVLPSLFLTAMLCPIGSIRKEIIRILRLIEGRLEVTWDPIELANMAEDFCTGRVI